MSRYHLIIVGQNVLLDRGAGEPVLGFVAARIIRCKTEAEAINLAKINLLKEWKINFNRNNKAGTPSLSIEQITPIKNPFKKLKFANELWFFTDEDEKNTHLEKSRHALKRWFRIR